MTKSASAAARSRLSISSQGVSRSLRLITAKSCISGAPSIEAELAAAVMPGIISTFVLSRATSSIIPAMPYIPGSPLEISPTVRPESESLSASSQRSRSLFIGEATSSLRPSKIGRTSSM